MNEEVVGNLIGLVLLFGATGWVRYDAARRGLKPSTALAWSVGVLLALIIFLPLYILLIYRAHPILSQHERVNGAVAPIAGVPCPYCGFETAGLVDFCPKCGRMLRSSTEIHRS